MVKSVKESIRATTRVIDNQQGDLLSWQDTPPANRASHHTASLQMRVPQSRLEMTLEALNQLGTV